MAVNQAYDAVIAGGGLAGLTLARQLQREAPHVRLLVIEDASQAHGACSEAGETVGGGRADATTFSLCFDGIAD